jgi:renalase
MRVAIVGAGLSGLAAARTLVAAGCAVTVFEKSAELGGRLATWEAARGTMDAGAQFFTVRTPTFRRQIDDWQERGLVGTWCHGFGADDGHPRHVAYSGMRSLAVDLADGLDVRLDTMAFTIRERPSAPGIGPGDGWVLVTDDGHEHDADAIILTAPLPQSYALLADVGPALDPDLMTTEYDRTIGWLAVLDRPPSIPSPGGLTSPTPDVSFVADNVAKGLSAVPAITLHAAVEWSEQHWDDGADRLRAQLVALAAPWIDDAAVISDRVVRWRFATPRRIHPEPCWVAPDRRIVLAGDAFAGPRVEGAYRSGVAAAAALLG